MSVLPLAATEPLPAVHELARLFGLGEVEAVGGFDECKNVHHRLTTSTGDYVLRTSHVEKTADTLRFEADLLGHLRRGGLPVPERVPTVHGEPFLAFEGAFYSVTRFVGGDELDVSDPTQVRTVGAALGKFHRLVRHFHSAHPAPGRVTHARRLRIALEVLTRLDDIVGGDVPVEIRYQLPYICATGTRVLDVVDRLYTDEAVTFIHGGCRKESALFADRRLVAILDFDSARPDLPLVDVAIAINDMARVHDAPDLATRSSLDLPTVVAFLTGYRAVEPLGQAELEGIYALLVVRRLLRGTVKLVKIPRGRPYQEKDAEKFFVELARARWLDAHREEMLAALEASG